MVLKNISSRTSLTLVQGAADGSTLFDGLVMALNMTVGWLALLLKTARPWIGGWIRKRARTQGSFFPMGFFDAPCCGPLLMLRLIFFYNVGGCNPEAYLTLLNLLFPSLTS